MVGQFLHIHRAYLAGYERVLREECGYKGPTPYWGEQKDASNFENSATLKAFGGEGSPVVRTWRAPFSDTEAPTAMTTADQRSIRKQDFALWATYVS